MRFKIGLENGIEGRSLAWVLDHSGCFAYGIDAQTALSALPAAIREYSDWIEAYSHSRWFLLNEIEIELVDTWQVYYLDQQLSRVESSDLSINAWFQHDWQALDSDQISRGLQLLDWSRIDLLETVRFLSPAALEATYPAERWSIAGILNHIGGAEWWYLDRLGLAPPRQQVPTEPFERLEYVRFNLNQSLPDLAGSLQVVGLDGEFWSPRKLLRRAAWHERDHTFHIRKLLEG
jgi:hypothetical protein